MSALDLRLTVPAAACWLISWIGVGCARTALVAAILGSLGLLVSAAAVLWVAAAARALRAALVILAAAGLTFGSGTALLIRTDRVDAHPLRQLEGATAAVVISATEDPKVSGADPDLVWIRARVHSVDGRAVPDAQVLVFASSKQTGGRGWLDLRVGQRVRGMAAIRAPQQRGLTAARLTMRGPPIVQAPAPGYQRLAEMVRARFRRACAAALGHREAGLLPGLVVGDTSVGEETVDAQFRQAGLTHLLAVSGANFALIVGSVVLLIAVVGGSIRATVVAGVFVTAAFAILVELSPSVIRAAVMGGIGLLAMAASRGRPAMPALAGAVVVGLLVWPGLAADAGFAMSVAATAALIVWAPRLREWLVERGWPRGVADAAAMSTVAYLVTAPLIALISGRVSLTAIAANLAVAPAVPLVTVLGAIALLLAAVDLALATSVAQLLITACEPGLWWILAVARLFGGPWATVPAGPLWVTGVLLAACVAPTVLRRARLARWGRDAPPSSAPRRQRLPDRARRRADRPRDGPRGRRVGASHPDTRRGGHRGRVGRVALALTVRRSARHRPGGGR